MSDSYNNETQKSIPYSTGDIEVIIPNENKDATNYEISLGINKVTSKEVIVQGSIRKNNSPFIPVQQWTIPTFGSQDIKLTKDEVNLNGTIHGELHASKNVYLFEGKFLVSKKEVVIFPRYLIGVVNN